MCVCKAFVRERGSCLQVGGVKVENKKLLGKLRRMITMKMGDLLLLRSVCLHRGHVRAN